MNFYDFVFGKGKVFLLTLLLSFDPPDKTPTLEEMEKYLIRIPVPNSENALKLATKMMVAIIHGMLLHCCRDTSSPSCIYKHSHLTIIL